MRINTGSEALLMGISTFAMTLQIYTIFVVVYKSPPAMKEYRYFLCFYTFCDFCYNFGVGYLLAPSFFFPAPGLIINGFADNLADIFGYDAIRVSFVFLIGCAVYVIQSQDYCLMYRFCVISQNPKILEIITWFPCKVFFQIIALIIAIGLTLPAYFSTSSLETLPIFEREHHDPIVKYVPPNSRYIFLDYTTRTLFNLLSAIAILFVLSEIICFTLAFYILKVLRENCKSFSAKTYKLHQQLTRILIFQLITPITCMVLPITAGIICLFLGSPLTNTSGVIGFLFMTIYPVFNALITIIFVSPYWKYTKSWLKLLIRPFITDNKEKPIILMPNTTIVSIGTRMKLNDEFGNEKSPRTDLPPNIII